MCLYQLPETGQGRAHPPRKADQIVSDCQPGFGGDLLNSEWNLKMVGPELEEVVRTCPWACLESCAACEPHRAGQFHRRWNTATRTAVTEALHTSHTQPAWPKHRPCSQWVATNKVRLLFLHNDHQAPCKPPFCSYLVITQNTVTGLQWEGHCLWVQINMETLAPFRHLMQMILISVRLSLPLFNTLILASDPPLSWCGCVRVYIHVCMGRAHSACCTCDRHKITSGVGL